MSDEQRKDDETEVEGHLSDVSVVDEPEDGDDDVEAHIRLSNVRFD